ncbi:MAG: hypothetical protein KF795_31170 [Labilithrix sp.]|nr:hypothetical protein [Labilithrix sp.]
MTPANTCKRALALLLAVAGAVFCQGCSDDPAAKGPKDEIEAILFPSTKLLSPEDLAALEPDAGDGRLVFRRTPAMIEGVEPGAILVGGPSAATPNGLLRVVVGVEKRGEGLALETAIAPPQLAFKKLHARVARPVSLDDGTLDLHDTGAPLGFGGKSTRTAPVNVVLFDGDGDTSTTNDQLRIEGAFTGAITYDLSLDLDWGDVFDLPAAVAACVKSVAKVLTGKKPSCAIEDMLPEVKVVFSVDPRLSSELRIVGQAARSFEKDFDIAKVHLAPIPLGGFLVFLPSLDVIASVEGGASASFRAGVKGHVELTSSVTVSSRSAGQPKIAPVRVSDSGFDIEDPEVGLHAHAKAKLGVRLNVPLYGAVGPYATAESSLSLVADPQRAPCWEVRSGLESTVGVRISTPDLPGFGHVTLLNWKAAPFKALDVVVASGSCKEPPPGATHLPPGSGPDAPALRSPAFAPWSTFHEGGSDGAAIGGPSLTGLVFSDLSRTIDNRWIVAGSEARSLLKIDEQGNAIWRAHYVTDDGITLGVLRTVPTRDAGLALLAAGDAGSSFELLRVGQAGGVAFRRSYALPLDVCAAPTARVLANDGPDGTGTGFIVAGECSGQGKAFVVHLDAVGRVLGASLWTGASNDAAFAPTAIARTGSPSELVLVGDARGTQMGDGMFVARLDDEGELRASHGYFACETSFNLSPTAVIAAESGGVTVVGGSHAQSRAFVARLRANGDVGFVTFPGFVDGSAPVFVPSAIAELPTSGFVMAASTVELTGDGDANVPAIALVGLDASGRTTWSRRIAPGGARAASFAALQLTTDGGAIVSSLVSSDPATGSAWTMKAFAKDGSLGSAGVVATNLALDDGPPCAVRSTAFAPAVTELEVVAETRGVRMEKR